MLTLQQNQTCNTRIDYSTIATGGIILPFVITLDLVNSILNPPAGQNQRFCYTITGVGSDAPEFKDLSHSVFGICSQIPQSQIVNITVDDVPQVFDDNVQLFIPPSVDPPTGCPGLKFNFPLNKVGGVLHICYELTVTRPIGPNPVCLFGGNTTASGLSICGPVCEEPITCEKTAHQEATICVPVTVTPFARTGLVTTICCGDPIITPGATTCPGPVNRSCHFTVTQRICSEVPIQFGARTSVGDLNVVCEDAAENGCTCNDTVG